MSDFRLTFRLTLNKLELTTPIYCALIRWFS
jgi:hypothetical protein